MENLNKQSSSTKQCNIKIARYVPGVHKKPEFAHHKVPFSDDISILASLHYIKEKQDTSLSYRYSCQMAICGSCGAMVNGKPKLMCKTFLKEYQDCDTITIEPLAHFPIIRDLVVDISGFIDKLISVKPHMLGIEEAKFKQIEGVKVREETTQTQAQLQMFKRYSQCINCLLCYSACPQYGRNKSFIGPAALALASRYNLDSRDYGKAERKKVYDTDHDGLWECTFSGFCSQVCPKTVKPATAIQSMKLYTTLGSAKDVILGQKEK